MPSHRIPPAHDGLAGVPALAAPHAPVALALAFWLATHASHEPAHDVSQQTPSTQLPDGHSRHDPGTAQSLLGVHASPWLFCGAQVPDFVQYIIVGLCGHIASEVQAAGHVVAPPHSTFPGHAGDPAVPLDTATHAPLAPHTLHAGQEVWPQQTPLTHPPVVVH